MQVFDVHLLIGALASLVLAQQGIWLFHLSQSTDVKSANFKLLALECLAGDNAYPHTVQAYWRGASHGVPCQHK